VNCKCERTRLHANVHQLLQSNLNFRTIEPVLHPSRSVERQQLLLLPLQISERVWNCKCKRTRLIANVHQLLRSNFIRPFFSISGCLCLCCTAVNQSTATTAIMSQDPVDADDLFDSPEKPSDLKTCSVFLLQWKEENRGIAKPQPS